MGCGSCGGGNRHNNNSAGKRHRKKSGADLSQFAFLTPRQLKLLEMQKKQKDKESE
jgi:hypothetical protein